MSVSLKDDESSFLSGALVLKDEKSMLAFRQQVEKIQTQENVSHDNRSVLKNDNNYIPNSSITSTKWRQRNLGCFPFQEKMAIAQCA